MNDQSKKLKIAFLHPDLGIGGAERLVVDAALSLKQRGHEVCIYTAEHNSHRSFEETNDGTLKVIVRGRLLPASVLGRLRAPCAIIRMAYLAFTMAFSRYDIIVCDLVSHHLPLLRLISKAKILFYCHFPDKLLTLQDSPGYRLYRLPINVLEQHGLKAAHKVVSNSQFTHETMKSQFPAIEVREPSVLYPGVDTRLYETIPPVDISSHTFVSINRYDPHKNLQLAADALARLHQWIAPEQMDKVRLVIAGSCDMRLKEQRHTLHFLQELILKLKLGENIKLIHPCSQEQKLQLLHDCLAVLYTPEHEHFGIVPLEAMAAARPVIAVNKGGPLETVKHTQTGFLCPPTPEAFAESMAHLLLDPPHARFLGEEGRKHVLKNFGMNRFGDNLEKLLLALREE